MQYYLGVGKNPGPAGYSFCLEPVPVILCKVLNYFLSVYLMEVGARRRMAAGRKGVKEKGLKMAANVRSILFSSPLQELSAITRVMQLQWFQV